MRHLLLIALASLLTASAPTPAPPWLRLEMVGIKDHFIPVLWFSTSEIDVAFDGGDVFAVVPDTLFQRFKSLSRAARCGKVRTQTPDKVIAITEFDGASERTSCALLPPASCRYLSALHSEAHRVSNLTASANLADLSNGSGCLPKIQSQKRPKEMIAALESHSPRRYHWADTALNFRIKPANATITARLSVTIDAAKPWRLIAESLVIQSGKAEFQVPQSILGRINPALFGFSEVRYRSKNPWRVCLHIPTDQVVDQSNVTIQTTSFSIDTKRGTIDTSNSCFSWRAKENNAAPP